MSRFERNFSASVETVASGAEVRALRIEAIQAVAIGEAPPLSPKRASIRKVGAVGSLLTVAAVTGAAVCGGGEKESTLAPPEVGGGEPLATRAIETPTFEPTAVPTLEPTLTPEPKVILLPEELVRLVVMR